MGNPLLTAFPSFPETESGLFKFIILFLYSFNKIEKQILWQKYKRAIENRDSLIVPVLHISYGNYFSSTSLPNHLLEILAASPLAMTFAIPSFRRSTSA